MNFFTRILDRIHADGDAQALAQGLTVEVLPGGRRRIGHPDLPAFLEARRRAVILSGPDFADGALTDQATRDALDATRQRMKATSRRTAVH
ncbi:hypothetical protein [Actinoplanes sp. HUAS TT8]|uniref:hypothetical protein n=1 Tax=Actinoplanes sp. HUAS TT8 TaxID=3447453 RepID=UPI003F51FA0F